MAEYYENHDATEAAIDDQGFLDTGDMGYWLDGEIVITDRFADSTRIFQGITRGDLTETVDRLHALMIGVEPDLTLLFDLDPAIGLARATARAGKELRFEDMGHDFQAKARAGFLALATRHDRFRLIDANADEATVAARVWQAVATQVTPR